MDNGRNDKKTREGMREAHSLSPPLLSVPFFFHFFRCQYSALVFPGLQSTMEDAYPQGYHPTRWMNYKVVIIVYYS